MIVNISSGLGAGGAENALKNLMLYFKNHILNVDFVVYSLTNNISTQIVDYDYKLFNLKSFNFIFNFFGLLMNLRKLKSLHKVKFLYWMYDACFVSIFVSLCLRTKSNWYIHHNLLSLETDSRKHRLMIKVLSYFSHYNFVENVYFVSQQSMELHVKRFGFSSDKSIYFPNCFESPQFPEFSINDSSNNLNVGCFGRYTEVKNHKFLFQICNHLKMNSINVNLHLAGIGLDNNNTELVSHLKSMGLLQNTTLYGQVSNINKLYDVIDLYVLCSFSEAFPMVVLESLQNGVYVVSSNLGDVPQLIHKNGIIIDGYNPDDYVQAIVEFLNYNHDYKLEIALSDYNYILQKFTYRHVLPKLPLFKDFINS